MKHQMKHKGFKSISHRIMVIMLMTISVFTMGVMLFNVTLLNQSKDDVIFQQLREAAEVKLRHEKEKVPKEDSERDMWVAHFFIEFEDGQYTLYEDKFIMKKYGNDAFIKALAEAAVSLPQQVDQTKVTVDGKMYYLHRQWLEDDFDEAMVFFISPSERPVFNEEMLFFLIAAIAIAYITSKIIANRIAKQVKELDAFAEEIAKRNWDAEVPKTSPDEIGLLAHSLEKMRDALKIAEERDRKFIQSNSHDLKTPVMLIRGYAQAIIDDVDVSQEKSKAEVILNESEKLEKRINNLLRLSTLEQALGYTDEWEPIRLDRLIKNVAEQFKTVSSGIEWQLDLKDCEVIANKEALLIAFENLLDNQCRFAASKISIEMNESTIRMSNDGPPFQMEDTRVLFQPLAKEGSGGYGLGLAIVDKVMKGHGWEIDAFNTTEGVCFEIHIPK